MADRIDNLGDKKHKLTADDASKGGKKSGQVRRDKRDIKELARADRRSRGRGFTRSFQMLYHFTPSGG